MPGMLQNRDLLVFVWFSDHCGLVVFLHFAVVLVFYLIFIVGISWRRRGVIRKLSGIHEVTVHSLSAIRERAIACGLQMWPTSARR